MDEDKTITWVAGRTGANMLGWGYFFSRRGFIRRNIRSRMGLANSRRRLECCLEDVEACLRKGGMKRIETRMRNLSNRLLAAPGERPPDPIGTEQAAEILNVGTQRVDTLLNKGRLKLYQEVGKRERIFSEKEVRILKREIDRWKEEAVVHQRELEQEREVAWKDETAYEKKKKNSGRIDVDNLRKFERGLALMITTREAAFYLYVSVQTVSDLIKRGILKGYHETPYWGGAKRLLLLDSDVKAFRNTAERVEDRARWEKTHRQRDWREETRKKLRGEKPAPFIPKKAPTRISTASEKKVVHVGPPEWTYSQSRDWTAYICEVEARVRRTMKPQW